LATKDKLISHYYKGKCVKCLCHIVDSLYLVGFEGDGLIVWNEETDQQLCQVSRDQVRSIKRVMTTS
jgi:hypothetical protein